MLITFIALSVGMALVVDRPLLDRIVLVLSAIPVALLANIARIALTGVLHETVSGQFADRFYHDLAGWVMIPFALVLYWIEIWVFSISSSRWKQRRFWPGCRATTADRSACRSPFRRRTGDSDPQ